MLHSNLNLKGHRPFGFREEDFKVDMAAILVM